MCRHVAICQTERWSPCSPWMAQLKPLETAPEKLYPRHFRISSVLKRIAQDSKTLLIMYNIVQFGDPPHWKPVDRIIWHRKKPTVNSWWILGTRWKIKEPVDDMPLKRPGCELSRLCQSHQSYLPRAAHDETDYFCTKLPFTRHLASWHLDKSHEIQIVSSIFI